MKHAHLLITGALFVVLAGCASAPPPQAYRSSDNSALIVQSLDGSSCQILAPTAVGRGDAAHALAQAKSLPQHQTAVIILENYSEPQLGHEFRDRSLDWFLGLRGLGYQHIVFLKGSGVTDPNGLPLLAEYD
jgi:hypothetical protein